MLKESLLISLFITFSIVALSQDPGMQADVEELKSKGKEALIKAAYAIIYKRNPLLEINPQDYEVTVWANQKEVLVKFRRLLRYQPRNKQEGHCSFDLSVNLVSNKILPFDDWFSADSFYIPSEKDKEAIEFLKSKGLPSSSFTNNVTESKNSYYVHLNNESTVVVYTIDKVTGEESSRLIGSFERMPPPDIASEPGHKDEDPLVEVRD